MKKVLFRDNIDKITLEGDLKSIKKHIEGRATECAIKNIPIVIGRDFIQDRVVYFMYVLNEEFSVLELEEQVDNFLQGKFNEV